MLCFDVFFSPEKLHFGCKKCIFSHSFWPRRLKQTSFYGELNYLQHSKNFSFFLFPSMFPVKTTQNKQTISWKRKILKFSLRFTESLQTNNVWDLMIRIVCLECFSLRWIIKRIFFGRRKFFTALYRPWNKDVPICISNINILRNNINLLE